MNSTSRFLNSQERDTLLKINNGEEELGGNLQDAIRSILLLDHGWDIKDISEALFLKSATIQDYYDKYKNEGFQEILKLKYHNPPENIVLLYSEKSIQYLESNPNYSP